jgi:hypothetical protein
MYRRPAEIPRARLPLLDQITVKTPCRESWDAMLGDDRTRFCTRCSKNVHDLSAMTEDEAETFLATHLDDETPCVRLFRRPDGRVLTSECSRGARTRHARNVTAGVAAGLCAAFAGTLALANVHVPDGRNLPKPRARIDVKRSSRASVDFAPYDVVPAPREPVLHELRGDLTGSMTGYVMGVGHSREPGQARDKPTLHEVKATASPGLPVAVVSRVVRQSYGRFRLCYENALGSQPDLAGGVSVRLLIDRDGSVLRAEDDRSDLPDPKTVGCIVRGFANLSFPQPDPVGQVSVSYRIALRPRP